MTSKNTGKVIKSTHEFKKHFFPHTYKNELEQQLTDEEKVELLLRRSFKQSAKAEYKEPPKSIRVANIEDLENSKKV